MEKQTDIAKKLKVSRTALNFIFKSHRPVSWNTAEKLADLFPGKTLKEWKYSTPDQIKQAFRQIK